VELNPKSPVAQGHNARRKSAHGLQTENQYSCDRTDPSWRRLLASSTHGRARHRASAPDRENGADPLGEKNRGRPEPKETEAGGGALPREDRSFKAARLKHKHAARRRGTTARTAATQHLGVGRRAANPSDSTENRIRRSASRDP
jgi:hypothetical protein